ncbi:MAG: DUF502 domain-containing protein [Opitutaceae bacterium]|nr:DUF502 domain-containing protein [Opitutaceae bacterium]
MAQSRLASLRNAFLSGLLLLAPLAVTWLVFSWLIERVGGASRPVLFFFLPENLLQHRMWAILWDVLATLIVIILVTALGYLSRYVFGRYFVGLAERFLQNVPGVGTVYNTVREIVDTFSTKNRSAFSRVVLIEYPRKGCFAIGFLTNETHGEVQAKTAGRLWNVFLPTTPNPTSGFLLMLPREEIIDLEISVGDGMKLIISGGSVVPSWPNAASAKAALENLPAPPPV